MNIKTIFLFIVKLYCLWYHARNPSNHHDRGIMHLTAVNNGNGKHTFEVDLSTFDTEVREQVQREVQRRFAQVVGTSLLPRTGVLRVTVQLGVLDGRNLGNAIGVISSRINTLALSRQSAASLVY
jgi:hypothetical protein